MAIQTQKKRKSDHTQNTKLAIVPSPPERSIDAANGIGDPLVDFGVFRRLTVTQIAVLKAISENLLSDNTHTDGEIAKAANVCVNTVRNCRKYPDFAEALAFVMRGMIKGKIDRYIQVIDKEAEKNWRAAKYMIELALASYGFPIPRQQWLNASDQTAINSARFQTADEVMDKFLIRFGELGVSGQELLERYEELRAEGAF